MTEYTDKICPYCKKQFKEHDEIVVCNTCDIPHHKTCWNENQGCTTEDCSGIAIPIVSTEDEPNSLLDFGNTETDCICTVCKAAMNSKHIYCLNCGSALPEPIQNGYYDANPESYNSFIPSDLSVNDYYNNMASSYANQDAIFTSSIPEGFQSDNGTEMPFIETADTATDAISNENMTSESIDSCVADSTAMPTAETAVNNTAEATTNFPNVCPACGTPANPFMDFCQTCGKILNFNTPSVFSTLFSEPQATTPTPAQSFGEPQSTTEYTTISAEPQPSPEGGYAHNFCAQCGAPVNPGARFCSNCGTPIA